MVASSRWPSERSALVERCAARAGRALCLALALTGGAHAQEAPDGTLPPEPTQPEEKRRLLLVLRGQCPDTDSTRRHLEPLLRRHRITSARAPGIQEVVATLSDEGARFRVSVAGTDRLVDEAARDCVERARIAAVLIALALEPPTIVSEEPREPAPQKPRAQPPPASSPPAPSSDGAPLSVDLEAFALLAGGLEPAVGAAVGPLVALRGGLGPWFSRFALGYVPARPLELTAGSATLSRVPLDLAVGYAWLSGAFSLETSLGLAADPLFVRADDLASSNDTVRFDVGPRATLGAVFGPSTLRGVALLRAAWFPRSYELFINPAGKVGETPSFWLELALGMRFGLR